MSKKNYTMSLETKTVDGIKTYAKENERSVSWVCNNLLKDGIDGVESDNKWMEIAHSYEYASKHTDKKLSDCKEVITMIATGINNINIEELPDDISDILNKFAKKSLDMINSWSD